MIPRPFDVLIFDLDDTLLSTTKDVTHPALESVFKLIVKDHNQHSIESLFSERKKSFVQFTKEAFLEHTTQQLGYQPDARKLFLDVYQTEVSKKIAFLNDEIRSLLSELKSTMSLFLVTHGDSEVQKIKIEKNKIKHFFNDIIYVEKKVTNSKTEAFASILKTEQINPERVLSIGNRLDQDIAEAKKLGFKTCRLLKGESSHLQPKNNLEVPDYTITEIQEISGICLVNTTIDTSP